MKSSFWHKVPVVRAFFPFVSGIGISMFYHINTLLIAGICAASFILFVVWYFFIKSYYRRWWHGVALVGFFFSFGILLHQLNNGLTHPLHFIHQPEAGYMALRITEPAQIKTKSIKLKGEIIGTINSSGIQTTANGKVLVYIGKDSTCKTIPYGSVLVLPATAFREIPPPMNPDEFNYKRYLAFNNIHYQAYTKYSQICFADTLITSALYNHIYALQDYFKQTLQTYIASANETGVAEALLYGYDDDIDAETIQAYSNTGTLHVLAVSGMHVGIIFMVLGWVLGFMDKKPRLKLLKLGFILLFLWAYSFLCGLSPSILRATVMFTFIIISQMLKRTTNVYNTLAASAFVLLLYDCNMLANVGFQLSYLAVLGIVFLQPLIYNQYTAPNRLLNEIWKITSVSLAAQITTCPIGILYFHQFPNCFLFSNLIIIPLTTIILYTGIVLLIISKVQVLASLVGKLMYYLIAFTDLTVKWVEQIPYAYINGLHISITQSILLYFVFGFLIFYLLKRQMIWCYGFIFSCLLFIAMQTWYMTENLSQNRVLCYHVPKQQAIHFIKGNEAVLFIDSLLWNDRDKIKFHLQQHIWKSGITGNHVVYTNGNWKTLNWMGKKIVVTGKTKPAVEEINPDMLVVTNRLNKGELDHIHPGQVMIISTVGNQMATELKTYFSRQHIPVHYTGDTGALEWCLNN